MWFFSHASRDQDLDEHEKVARLERAETELLNLKGRASRAITTLDDRRQRNHWRESIEQMIQGGL
jgi:hypothetical protein